MYLFTLPLTKRRSGRVMVTRKLMEALIVRYLRGL